MENLTDTALPDVRLLDFVCLWVGKEWGGEGGGNAVSEPEADAETDLVKNVITPCVTRCRFFVVVSVCELKGGCVT